MADPIMGRNRVAGRLAALLGRTQLTSFQWGQVLVLMQKLRPLIEACQPDQNRLIIDGEERERIIDSLRQR